MMPMSPTTLARANDPLEESVHEEASYKRHDPLPFEILSIILGILSDTPNRDEHTHHAVSAAIRTCLLVSRAFYALARPLVFGDLKIFTNDSLVTIRDRLATLSRLLVDDSANPTRKRLAPLVHSLTIDLSILDPHSAHTILTSGEMCDVLGILLQEGLQAGADSKLKSFSLIHECRGYKHDGGERLIEHGDDHVAWPADDSLFATLVLEILRLPSMRTAHLSHVINLPQSFLRGCLGVTDIILKHCETVVAVGTEEAEDDDDWIPTPQPKVLCVHGQLEDLEGFLRGKMDYIAPYSQLEKLTIRLPTNFRNMATLNGILSQAPLLTHLTIDNFHELQGAGEMDLSPLNLQHLHLTVDPACRTSPYERFDPRILLEYALFVKNVHISLTYVPKRDTGYWSGTANSGGWVPNQGVTFWQRMLEFAESAVVVAKVDCLDINIQTPCSKDGLSWDEEAHIEAWVRDSLALLFFPILSRYHRTVTFHIA